MLQWIKRRIADKVRKLVGQELNDYTIRMAPEWQRMVYDEAPKVDTDAVAKAVAAEVVTDLTKNAAFVEKVAGAIDVDLYEIANTIADTFDTEDIARQLDISEIASSVLADIEIDTDEVATQVGNNLDLSDVANEINMHDLAGEIHMPDLAEAILLKMSSELYTELAEQIDISGKLDYQKLATALLEAVRKEAAGV